jgi:uncharacterized protein YukJ
MALRRYGVLKGQVLQRRLAFNHHNHYQIHVVANETEYRVAVNVRSDVPPSVLEYCLDASFQHPITRSLNRLPPGFKHLQPRPNSLALDYCRSHWFSSFNMQLLPHSWPGPDNDLNEKIDHYVQLAKGDRHAWIYVYGEPWGPNPRRSDEVFGFPTLNGIHNVHMNQGNLPQFQDDDGVYQDGALLFQFASEQRWVAVFFKFQSQCWHTDDVTGHCNSHSP